MNKTIKILLGIFTFLPLVFVIGSVTFGIYQILTLLFSIEPVNPFIFIPYVAYIFPIVLIYSAFYLLLGIFYLIHLLRNERLDNEKKILWIAVFFAFNALSLPVYWVVHIWRDESNQKAEVNSNFGYESSGTES